MTFYQKGRRCNDANNKYLFYFWHQVSKSFVFHIDLYVCITEVSQ